MARDLSAARLYAILDLGYVDERELEATARQLIEGGADLLQLRAKGCAEEAIEGFARRVLPICRDSEIPFIINDYPGIAARVAADGIHIGQDDGSLSDVRKSVGPEMLVGRSTHSLDQARAALAEGFDYIGFGPLFPTPTKRGRPGIGMENIPFVEAEVGRHIPVFCIGGIKRGNLTEVVTAGAKRVVIVSDLLTASDIAGAVQTAKSQIADL